MAVLVAVLVAVLCCSLLPALPASCSPDSSCCRTDSLYFVYSHRLSVEICFSTVSFVPYFRLCEELLLTPFTVPMPVAFGLLLSLLLAGGCS